MRWNANTGSEGQPSRRIADLATQQHGVVSRRQLRGLGLSDRAIDGAAEVGRLHPLFPGTFAVGHNAIGRHGLMLAATLTCGPDSLVSHGTAAELLGLRDHAPESIDVIPPERQSGRKIQGIRWHRVPYPTGEEQTVEDHVPCTSPSRTLIDLAGTLGWRSLRSAVERAAVLQLLDAIEILNILELGPRRKGARKLRVILSGWIGADRPRLRSELEARFLALIADTALRRPRCNTRVRAAGKSLEVDFLWPAEKLVVEVDGRTFHDSPAAFERDRDRDQHLTLAGYRVVRFTWHQIVREPLHVRRTLTRLLGK